MMRRALLPGREEMLPAAETMVATRVVGLLERHGF